MGRHCKRKPCAFCGWVYSTAKWRRGHGAACWIECCSCQARGPLVYLGGKAPHDVVSEASKLWDNRNRPALSVISDNVVPIVTQK